MRLHEWRYLAKPVFKSTLCRWRVHTGEEPFKGKDCGKAFSEKNTFIRYQSTHSGEKVYVCKECGRAFHVNSQLICHRLLRPGEKPYRCKEYGTDFTRSSNLVPHQKIHSGEKAYQSTYAMWEGLQAERQCINRHHQIYPCKTDFKVSSGLKQHRGLQENRNPTRGGYGEHKDCGKTFIWNSNVILHQSIPSRETLLNEIDGSDPPSAGY